MFNFDYKQLSEIAINNTTDYSKIIWRTSTNEKYTLHMGMANLGSKNAVILDPNALLDQLLIKNGFVKEYNLIKGIEKIIYKRSN